MNVKLLSLFSGIGAFETAFDRLNIHYDLVNYCEIDKYASKSYAAIHGVSEELNLWDVSKIDTSKLPSDLDLITYGFPCQDISIAGKKRGFEHEGKQTRSGLFFEALRIIEDTKPKYAIAENVKNLVGDKFEKEFGIVLNSLNAAGYNNYWEVLNSKDFGIPQNRERVFIVSIRKDVDFGFCFPQPKLLNTRLKDFLQKDVVDKKYYVKKAERIRFTDNYIQWDNSGKNYNSQAARAYYIDGLAPTLSSSNKNGDKSQIILFNPTPRVIGGFGKRVNNDTQWHQQNRIYNNDIAITVTSSFMPYYLDGSFAIRRLTPLECWRLMGFTDEEFDKASKVVSNSSLYKQAGNSIVVNVIEAIYRILFLGENRLKQITFEDLLNGES